MLSEKEMEEIREDCDTSIVAVKSKFVIYVVLRYLIFFGFYIGTLIFLDLK